VYGISCFLTFQYLKFLKIKIIIKISVDLTYLSAALFKLTNCNRKKLDSTLYNICDKLENRNTLCYLIDGAGPCRELKHASR